MFDDFGLIGEAKAILQTFYLARLNFIQVMDATQQ
jgi:hypothetical protein